MEPLLCPMRAASLPCPHWRPIFANFSLTIWVTKYFLGIGRKVNSFAAILLVVSSSQLLFLGLSTSVDTGEPLRGKPELRFATASYRRSDCTLHCGLDLAVLPLPNSWPGRLRPAYVKFSENKKCTEF